MGQASFSDLISINQMNRDGNANFCVNLYYVGMVVTNLHPKCAWKCHLHTSTNVLILFPSLHPVGGNSSPSADISGSHDSYRFCFGWRRASFLLPKREYGGWKRLCGLGSVEEGVPLLSLSHIRPSSWGD